MGKLGGRIAAKAAASVVKEKTGYHWLETDVEKFGEVFRVKHGKSTMVMHGEKFSPQYSILFSSFNHDGTQLCTASEDRTARTWDVETGEQLKCFEHKDWVRTCRFNTEGTLLITACYDGYVRIWDAVEESAARSTTIPKQQIQCGKMALTAAFSPDGRVIATGSFDKTARIWDVRTLTNDLRIEKCLEQTWMVKFAYEMDCPAISFDQQTTMLATACGDCVARIHAVPEDLPLDYVPPQQAMVQLNLAKMKIEDLKLRCKKKNLAEKGRKMELVDRLTEIGGDQTPEEPPPDPQRSLHEFIHPDKVSDVEFSADAKWLVTACRDKHARILDVETGQALASYKHGNWLASVRMLPDTSVLCTACDDGLVRVWNVRKEEELVTFQIGGSPTCAQFSTDGKKLCVSSRTAEVKVYGVVYQDDVE